MDYRGIYLMGRKTPDFLTEEMELMIEFWIDISGLRLDTSNGHGRLTWTLIVARNIPFLPRSGAICGLLGVQCYVALTLKPGKCIRSQALFLLRAYRPHLELLISKDCLRPASVSFPRQLSTRVCISWDNLWGLS